ncbi:MAG: sigma-70 domain-containing protein [Lachnospiraceae bacterium]
MSENNDNRMDPSEAAGENEKDNGEKGTESAGGEAEDGLSGSHFADILQEISQIPELTPEEERQLISRLPDSAARDRLIQGSLIQVVRIAATAGGKDTELEDLLQEGNVALTIFVRNFRGGDFEKQRDEAVRTAIRAYLDSVKETSESNDHYTDMINQIMDASTEIASRTGKTPTVRQIAERTGLTDDEVERLMREAVNATTTESADQRLANLMQPDDVTDYLFRQQKQGKGEAGGDAGTSGSAGKPSKAGTSWEENLARKLN